GVEGLGDGRVLLQVLVEIHVVAGQNDHSRFGIDADVLRLKGMLAAGVAGDAGKDLLGVAIDQAEAAGEVQLDGGKHVVGVDAAVGARLLPGFTRVVVVLVLLQPDAGTGKQVHAVGMVPVHVGDDHVSNVLRLHGRSNSRLGHGI